MTRRHGNSRKIIERKEAVTQAQKDRNRLDRLYGKRKFIDLRKSGNDSQKIDPGNSTYGHTNETTSIGENRYSGSFSGLETSFYGSYGLFRHYVPESTASEKKLTVTKEAEYWKKVMGIEFYTNPQEGLGGITLEQAAIIAPQIKEHVRISKKLSKEQHVLVDLGENETYVHINPLGFVKLPQLVSDEKPVQAPLHNSFHDNCFRLKDRRYQISHKRLKFGATSSPERIQNYHPELEDYIR
jgi:hypothetical protein